MLFKTPRMFASREFISKKMKKIFYLVFFMSISCSKSKQLEIIDPITKFSFKTNQKANINKKQLLQRFLDGHKEDLKVKGIQYNEAEAIKLFNNRPDSVFVHLEKDEMNFFEGSTFLIPENYQNDEKKEIAYVEMMYNYIKESMIQDYKSAGLSTENIEETTKIIASNKFKNLDVKVIENDKLILNQTLIIGVVNNGIVLFKMRNNDKNFKNDIERDLKSSEIKKH